MDSFDGLRPRPDTPIHEVGGEEDALAQPPLKKPRWSAAGSKGDGREADAMPDAFGLANSEYCGGFSEADLLAEVNWWLTMAAEQDPSCAELELAETLQRVPRAWTDRLSEQLVVRVADYLSDADGIRLSMSDRSAHHVLRFWRYSRAVVHFAARINLPDRYGIAAVETMMRVCDHLSPQAQQALGACLVRLAERIDVLPDLAARLDAFGWLARTAPGIRSGAIRSAVKRWLVEANVISEKDGAAVIARLQGPRSAAPGVARQPLEFSDRADSVDSGAEEAMKFAQRLSLIPGQHRATVFGLLAARAQQLPQAMRPVFLRVLAGQLLCVSEGRRFAFFQSLAKSIQSTSEVRRESLRQILAASICHLRPSEWWEAFHLLSSTDPHALQSDKASLLKTMLQFPRTDMAEASGRLPLSLSAPQVSAARVEPLRRRHFQAVTVAAHLHSVFEAADGLSAPERKTVLAHLVQRCLSYLPWRERLPVLERLLDAMSERAEDLPWVESFVRDLYLAREAGKSGRAGVPGPIFDHILDAVIGRGLRCAPAFLRSLAKGLSYADRAARLGYYEKLCQATARLAGMSRLDLLFELASSLPRLEKQDRAAASEALISAAKGLALETRREIGRRIGLSTGR